MTSPRPVDLTAQDFRRLGHALIDQIADHLARLPDGLVKPDETAAAVRAALGADRALPEHGTDPAVLLSKTAQLLFEHSLFNGHPRFFGYITSSAAPIGVLGDLLASAINQNCGSWSLSPMATEIEAQTVSWIADFIGFAGASGEAANTGLPRRSGEAANTGLPRRSGEAANAGLPRRSGEAANAGLPRRSGEAAKAGLLVSGGNMANFVCFLAARTAKAGWDARTEGLSGSHPQLVAYASAETHTWIQKAADLFGLGTNAIRWIPVDEHQRMKTAELRRQIAADRAAGQRPFIVVGTAGSVSTGAVDPLPEIASICRDEDLWFHVDGAYGAFAADVPSAPTDLRGLSEADSVAVDPHKWLYAPLEAGCALVRRPADLRNAFSYHPPYYRFNDDVLNFVDYGPQNSRGFRALKVWLALQQIGRQGYLDSIAEDMRLSRKLYELLGAHPQFEVFTQALSITTFRHVPPELRSTLGEKATEDRLNTLNEELLVRVQKSGQAYFSNAVINGKFALRACIVNFRTSDSDIEALPRLIESEI